MNRLNRRRFLALSSAGAASAILVACGNPKPSLEEVNPTQIPDVAGAPPTLAPITSTPNSEAQSGGGQEQGGGGEASGGAATEVTIDALDTLRFDPAEFSIAPGGKITLDNKGVLQHDFALDDWGGVLIGPLDGGTSGDYTVPEDTKPGTYDFYCSIPGHEAAGMVGKVTVGEAGSGGGEEEATAEEGGAASGGGAETVDLKAEDIKFSETEFSIAPGGTINLQNDGQLEHDIAVDAWSDKPLIGPLKAGESGSYTIPDDVKPGETFDYYCTIPGHEAAGMKGVLTIAEAGSGGGSGEAAPAESGEATAAASPEGESATPAASPEGGAAPAASEGGSSSVDLEAYDIGFKPTEFTVAPGGTINLDNTGVLEHDFAVDDWGGVKIGPLSGGDKGSFTVPDDAKSGETFDFYCSIPGHEAAGMKGKLTIA